MGKIIFRENREYTRMPVGSQFEVNVKLSEMNNFF